MLVETCTLHRVFFVMHTNTLILTTVSMRAMLCRVFSIDVIICVIPTHNQMHLLFHRCTIIVTTTLQTMSWVKMRWTLTLTPSRKNIDNVQRIEVKNLTQIIPSRINIYTIIRVCKHCLILWKMFKIETHINSKYFVRIKQRKVFSKCFTENMLVVIIHNSKNVF